MFVNFSKFMIRFGQSLLFLIVWPYSKIIAWRSEKKSVPPIKDKLLLASAGELAEMIRNRKTTAVSVLDAYISRINEVEPIINGIVQERFQRAREEAAMVDAEIRNNPDPVYWQKAKPLYGVPISIKESIPVEGMSNNAGTPRNITASSDAEAVANLRAAGAIPIMVTNTPELCLFWESYNPISGMTRNPFDTTRTAGGSSGGECALLGSGASAVGLGSDIVGSGRLPAHFCGVFGHKPTRKIISVKGHMPTSLDEEWSDFLVLSPVARYAQDLSLVLTSAAPEASKQLNLHEPVDLSKIRIHYMDDCHSILIHSVDSEIKDAVAKAANHFENAFGSRPQKVHVKRFDSSLVSVMGLMLVMKSIQTVLQKSDDPEDWGWKEVIKELFKGLLGLSKNTMYAISYCLLRKIVDALPKRFETYCSRLQGKLHDDFTKLLGNDGILILPVFPHIAHEHYQMYYKMTDCVYMAAFNLLGMPATAVPVGQSKSGLPIGIQVVATQMNDRLTLAVAEELERAFGGWKLKNL